MLILSVLYTILSFSLPYCFLFPHLLCSHHISSSECVLYNIIEGKCDIMCCKSSVINAIL